MSKWTKPSYLGSSPVVVHAIWVYADKNHVGYHAVIIRIYENSTQGSIEYLKFKGHTVGLAD
jgi:hypothetical protein